MQHFWTQPRSYHCTADVLIFMIVEALVVQIFCALYELYLVYQLEAARGPGILALVGLPAPVLRQLTAVEMKIVNDSDDETDAEGSFAGSETNMRDGKGGGGGSVKQSQQQAVAIALTAVAAAPAAGTVKRNGSELPEGEIEATGKARSAGLDAARDQGQQGTPAHTGSGEVSPVALSLRPLLTDLPTCLVTSMAGMCGHLASLWMLKLAAVDARLHITSGL
ncbi:hypothetical protein Vafri_11716 [Volvox africanus]|uniref:Uncharacterized protein n=1 Tax=Volvox africanus TaxID=51714 RepID=A0A8J4B8H9_9CHLO|nr:hypothetical protein Vafri_11716 [Volvox africanus]